MTTLSTAPVPIPAEWPISTQTDPEPIVREATDVSKDSLVDRVPLEKVQTGVTVTEVGNPLEIVGSTNIYDEHGKVRLIPVCPTDHLQSHCIMADPSYTDTESRPQRSVISSTYIWNVYTDSA